MIYNPNIKNPTKKKVEGNFYQLSVPTTVLDLMLTTGSFEQEAQRDLAKRFAGNYEHAQSLLRPVNETIRFFTVDPGGGYWILDNGRNLRVVLFFIADVSASLNYGVTMLGWWILSRIRWSIIRWRLGGELTRLLRRGLRARSAKGQKRFCGRHIRGRSI
jgi:hypothetical protein